MWFVRLGIHLLSKALQVHMDTGQNFLIQLQVLVIACHFVRIVSCNTVSISGDMPYNHGISSFRTFSEVSPFSSENLRPDLLLLNPLGLR